MPAPTLEQLSTCLGGPWPEPCPLEASVQSVEQKDGYRLGSVTYHAEPDDTVPAYLLVPDAVNAGAPAPGICVWHQHAGQWHLGKSEPAGVDGNSMHHTGVALAREGYVVLCPDALAFEDRRDSVLEGRDYEWFLFCRYVVSGMCLAWKNILDMRRAVDYLQGRPEVDADRIGCYGHSMGSSFTWLVGPFEPRLKCLVGNCCMPTYEAIHRHRIRHCATNYIPGWLRYGDLYDVAALTAPRALHLNFGETDGGSPIDEVKKGLETIRRQYAEQGAADRFSAYIEEGSGHVLSDEMWQRVRDVFARYLRS